MENIWWWYLIAGALCEFWERLCGSNFNILYYHYTLYLIKVGWYQKNWGSLCHLDLVYRVYREDETLREMSHGACIETSNYLLHLSKVFGDKKCPTVCASTAQTSSPSWQKGLLIQNGAHMTSNQIQDGHGTAYQIKGQSRMRHRKEAVNDIISWITPARKRSLTCGILRECEFSKLISLDSLLWTELGVACLNHWKYYSITA